VRNLRELDGYRDTSPEVIAHYGDIGDHSCGVFSLVSPGGAGLRVIASCGDGWDHVSVSARGRCPSWEEMAWIKRTFFHPSEAVMQLHVPDDDHIDCHPHCLHLWRPRRTAIPLPPAWMVGPKPRKDMAPPDEAAAEGNS
jgi:hypothetical protein